MTSNSLNSASPGFRSSQSQTISFSSPFTPPISTTEALRANSLFHHVNGQSFSSNLKPPYCHVPSTNRNPPRAVFDFVRKIGEEQKKAFNAIRENKGMEYVRDKVKRDIEQVTKFNSGLAKSRERLARDLNNIISGGAIEKLDDVLEELEEVLIMSDLGTDTVDRVLDHLRKEAKANRLINRDDIKLLLKESLVQILTSSINQENTTLVTENRTDETHIAPTIYIIIGANGMGKTTTIGKLATRFRRQGKSVLVAACDTFRAAAVDQLEEWVKRADAKLERPSEGQKAASGVLYSALERAYKENFDYLLIDTSGRLHTNTNLMGELEKMVRVIQKFRKEGAHETLLVVDASIGRNAVTQARTWQKAVGVSALAITKLDGTARAGFVVSCVDELNLPVKLIGVGEKVDDLRDFDPELFVDGLVG